jgi:hypothetical protein
MQLSEGQCSVRLEFNGKSDVIEIFRPDEPERRKVATFHLVCKLKTSETFVCREILIACVHRDTCFAGSATKE